MASGYQSATATPDVTGLTLFSLPEALRRATTLPPRADSHCYMAVELPHMHLSPSGMPLFEAGLWLIQVTTGRPQISIVQHAVNVHARYQSSLRLLPTGQTLDITHGYPTSEIPLKPPMRG